MPTEFAVEPGQVVPWSTTPTGRRYIEHYSRSTMPYPAVCTVYESHDQNPNSVCSVPFRLVWDEHNRWWTAHECNVQTGDSLWFMGVYQVPEVDDRMVLRYIEQNGIWVHDGFQFPQVVTREEWNEWQT